MRLRTTGFLGLVCIVALTVTPFAMAILAIGFSTLSELRWVWGALVLVAYALWFRAHDRNEEDWAHRWPGVAITAAAFIGMLWAFADIYARLGVLIDGKVVLNASASDRWRLSVLALTGTSYGDILPAPAARWPAAFEALIGYLLLGIMVGLLASWLTPRRPG